MKTIWFISDTHFFHENMLKFVDEEGDKVRPEFSCVEEMNEVMRDNWNRVVKPGDHVYHLGDVAMGGGKEIDPFIRTLNGRKRLVVGNHDNIRSPAILNNFDKIMLWRHWKDEGLMCSHIPLRQDQIRGGGVNVHGHIHEKVMQEPGYFSVCVEQIDYIPISMEELTDLVKNSRL